jgi:hypothetical protein
MRSRVPSQLDDSHSTSINATIRKLSDQEALVSLIPTRVMDTVAKFWFE